MAGNSTRKFAIILAAGDGKRMKSAYPKALCQVLFKPMIRWVTDACRKAGLDEIYIVAGNHVALLEAAAGPGCGFFLQKERRGTGHAAMMAAQALEDGGDAIILYADAPFVSAELISSSYEKHKEHENTVTVVTAHLEDPAGYGRIIRGATGGVAAIVEERDADETQREIHEVNSGVCWFDAAFLKDALPRLSDKGNTQGEYYLTDTIRIAVEEYCKVGGYVSPDRDAILGANDRAGLAKLNEVARGRVIRRHLENGVDIPLCDGIIIGADVTIGQDTCILPGTILKGDTAIANECIIGPNTVLERTAVEEGTEVKSSYATDSSIGKHCKVGPYTQLRPNSVVKDYVKIGDFVEVKNSVIGDHTSIAHLTYIGDSDVGEYVNFGCGVVTANYDGKEKYRTEIGDRAFIGCNTNLIPPVKIGAGAYTAAGTTVAADVPDGALAIGRPKTEIKDGWADKNIGFKQDRKK